MKNTNKDSLIIFNNIERIIKESGKTKFEVCTYAYVSLNALNNIKKCKSVPKISMLKRLADELGVTVDTFYL